MLVLAGLSLIGLFYLADLVVMLIFPLFMPREQAMTIMADLHLNLMWLVALGGVGLMVAGLTPLVRVLLPRTQAVIDELEEANRKLTALATTDALTGLANRRLFDQQLHKMLAHAERHHRQIAVLFMDLDGFKGINDRFGHRAGDVTLCVIAERLHASLRESDLVARVGGDEFAVILPETGYADARKVAEKLRKAIIEPIVFDGDEFRVGASIGASYYPQDGTTFDKIVTAADNAMYQCKPVLSSRRAQRELH